MAELLDERRSDLEVRYSLVQELEGFEQTPLVLLHEESCDGAGRSGLPLD